MKTLSSSIKVFSSLGLCLIVLALKEPTWSKRYLCYVLFTYDDRIQGFLTLADSQQVVFVGLVRVTVIFFYLELSLSHMVLNYVFLFFYFHFYFLFFLVLMPMVVGRSILIFGKIILILLLLPVMLILAFYLGLTSGLVRNGKVVILVLFVLYFEFVAVIGNLVLDGLCKAAWAFLHLYAFLKEMFRPTEIISDSLA